MNRIYLIVLFYIKSVFATTYTCDPTVSCGCSLASTVVSARIAGGQAAANSSWGWAVSFQRLESHICGGSLISDEFAVTAAHCINEIYSISEFSIVVGTNYILNITDTAAQRRQLIDYFIHPDFDIVTLENDIALVRFLPVSIPSNSTVSIICLPADDQDPFAIGSNLVAIGWGTLNDSIRVAYPYLEQVTLQAYSPTSNQCVQSNFMNATTQICAGVVAGGKDTCAGDSGGPLMTFFDNTWVLVGITSNGIGCAQAGYSGIYTRVSFYIPFIQNIVNNTGVTVRSTLRTTPLTSASTVTVTIQKTSNRAGNSNSFLGESISFFILWLLVIINV